MVRFGRLAVAGNGFVDQFDAGIPNPLVRRRMKTDHEMSSDQAAGIAHDNDLWLEARRF